MKVILALGVVLAVSVALSSAQCYFDSLKTDLKSRTKACKDKGELHEVGKSWTSDCMKCSCSKGGLQCCSMIHTPFGYDEQNCEKKFHEESCSYTVTKKNNPSEECEFKGMTG